MSVCVARRNPTRIPRRDLLIQASDTPTLQFTIYQQDTDTAPLDVNPATLTMSLYRDPGLARRNGCFWWDYGFGPDFFLPYTVATFTGVAVDPSNGRIDISISAGSGICVPPSLPVYCTPPPNPPSGTLAGFLIGHFIYELAIGYGLDAVTGIGIPTGPGAANPNPNYAQGFFTILRGSVDFVPGAQLVPTQNVGLLSNIGVPAGPQLLGADGAPLLGADGSPLLSPSGT